MPSNKAVVFVENHDSERGQGAGGADVLTYKDGKLYRMAIAFTLAHPFGVPKVMSGFAFERSDQGPPADKSGNIISPNFNSPNCDNGWVCQHRWLQVYNMIKFRNSVKDAPISNWWSDGSNQMAFARKGRGFIAFNNEKRTLNVSLQTSLSAGSYCDIISGEISGDKCTGKIVLVDKKGMANIVIEPNGKEGVLAILLEDKLQEDN